MSAWVVVLAGGIGSRFWPLSTPDRPKQLLPLVTERPLLVETVRRLQPLADVRHTLVLTNASLVGSIAELLPELPPANLIAEPRPAGTAAALTWAAQEIARRDGPDAIMTSVHADWAIGDDDTFRLTLRRASEIAATHRALVTIGIVPTRAETGFGYIQLGKAIDGPVRRVARFVEKPDTLRAEALRREGCLWNSGIFVWRVGDFLDEVRRLTPEVAGALHAHANDMFAFFAAVAPISVDVGVLERSDRVVVVPAGFAWDDVGTWGALARVRPRDQAGNAVVGRVHLVESANNVVHAESANVVLYGVSDLVVVAVNGLVMVTTVDRSADLKSLMDALPRGVRERE